MLMGLTDLSLYFRFQTAIGRPPRPAVLLRMLCPTGAAFVAVRDDGRAEAIVGHAMWAWAPGESTAELAAVISEAEQRRGLGIRMLSIAAADAIAAGATRFLFVVRRANQPPTRRGGFFWVGRPPKHPWIRMVRRRWPEATIERDGTSLNFVVAARLPDQP